MRVGVDFDNTIVCYDRLFHRAARERGLIPAGVAVSKAAVRDHLRAAGAEDAWTALQGHVYGARMAEADPFPGVEEFLRLSRGRGIEVVVVSHRTPRPHAGPPCDLAAAARGWLESRGFFDPAGVGLGRDRAYFEPTEGDKLARIALAECAHFIDDLPEFLANPGFPAGVERLLFDPGGRHRGERRFARVESWAEAASRLLGGRALAR